ncbi:hypothetical protein CATMQ487_33060 [Sphaerotilus microaerophilus]|uniref:Uncharacterized protein n=1 Tax=Sphaerotilus microaerophilus TaxID=2914710 RepID=A0ABN6PMB5_9BURK|nr:hypothetical protein CATMQ487_33060 [Sphaerotilus sp. FB-5]
MGEQAHRGFHGARVRTKPNAQRQGVRCQIGEQVRARVTDRSGRLHDVVARKQRVNRIEQRLATARLSAAGGNAFERMIEKGGAQAPGIVEDAECRCNACDRWVELSHGPCSAPGCLRDLRSKTEMGSRRRADVKLGMRS